MAQAQVGPTKIEKQRRLDRLKKIRQLRQLKITKQGREFTRNIPGTKENQDAEIRDSLLGNNEFATTVTNLGLQIKQGQFGAREGAKLGARLGSRFGAPGTAVGGIIGGAGGAAVGSMAGEAETIGLQKANVLPGEGPPTVEEGVEQVLDVGKEAFKFETGFRGGAKALSLLKPFAKQIREIPRQAQRTLSKLSGGKKTLTLGQLVDNDAIDSLENIAGAGFFGRKPLVGAVEETSDFIQKNLSGFVKTLRGTRGKDSLTDLVENVVGEKKDYFDAIARGLYSKVDKLTAGATVDYTGVKKVAAELLKEAQAGVKSAPRVTILKSILKKPDIVSFADAQQLRSDLGAISRAGTDLIPNKTIGIGKKMFGEVDNAMNATFDQLPTDEAKIAFRDASDFWKEGKDLFNSRIMKAVAGSDADTIFEVIKKSKSGSELKRVFDVLDDPESRRFIQGEFFDDILTGISKRKQAVKILDGDQILDKIDRVDGFVKEQLFPKGKNLKEFEELSTALSVSRGKPIGAGGAFAVKLIQVSAAISLIQLDFEAFGVASLLVPGVVSRAFTNPSLVKALTKGVEFSQKAKTTGTALTQTIRFLKDAGFDVDHQSEDDAKKVEENLLQ